MARQYPSKSRSGRNITSITYWRRFAEHRLMYIVLAFVFGFGIIAYFGTGPMGGGPSRADQERASGQTVVTVNGEPVTRQEYDRLWDRMKSNAGSSDLQAATFQGYILNNLISQAVMRAAAKKAGLTVSDADIDKQIRDEKTQLARGGKPVPDADYERMLDMQGYSLSDYRQELKNMLLPQELRKSYESGQKLNEQDLLKTYDQARVRHILVSTSKVPEAQAKNKAEKILAEVKAGKDFATLANENTDDPSNQPTKYDPKTKKMEPSGPKKGGDLGVAPLSNYMPEFADAARALKPGQVSGIVKTSYGYHIIKMEEYKRELPKDYEKNKVKLLEDFKKQKAQTAFGELMQKEEKSAKLVWSDQSLKWRYDYAKSNGMFGGSFDMDSMKNRQQFPKDLAEYVAKNPHDAAAALVLGKTIYQHDYILAPPGPEREKKRSEVIKLYEAGLKSTEDQSTRFDLAQLYREAKKDDEALKQYTLIQRLLRWETGTSNKQTHVRLERALKDLGRPELAAQEATRITQITEEERKQAEEAKKKQEEEKKKTDEEKKKNPAGAQSKPGGTKVLQSGTFTVPAPGKNTSPSPEPPATTPKKDKDATRKIQ